MASFHNQEKVSNQAAEQHIYGNVYFNEQRSDNSSFTQRYYDVPNIAVPKFFGREDILRQLRTTLAPSNVHDHVGCVVLQGMGGQGKSQIALKFCQLYYNEYRAVFWVDASTRASVDHGFDSMSKTLSSGASDALNDIKAKIKNVHHILQDWTERWLLVFDNYDDPEAFAVREYMPICGQGSIIVTSRHKGTKYLGQMIEVPSMVHDHGVELLLRDMPRDKFEQSKKVGSQVVERLGGLALALDQAASYMSSWQIEPSTFIHQYEKKKKKILTHIRELWEYRRANELDYEESLSAFTTWELSWQQVSQDQKLEQEHIEHFLSLSAFLEPSHISDYVFRAYVEEQPDEVVWPDIFKSTCTNPDEDDEDDSPNTKAIPATTLIWDDDQFWTVITKLERLSLIQSVARSRSMVFTLHPLIRDWLQLRQKKNKLRRFSDEAIRMIIKAIQKSNVSQSNGNIKEELIAHVDSWVSDVTTMGIPTASTRDETFILGFFCRDYGRYHISENLFRPLMENDQKNLPEDHPNVLRSISALAGTYWMQGRLKEALQLGEEVVEKTKRSYSEVHPDTLTSLSNLVLLYMRQGRLKEGEQLGVELLERKRRVLGEDDPATLRSISTLASIYEQQGRFDEAEQLGMEAVEGRRRVLGKEHPETLSSMSDLATVYHYQRRFDEAEQLGLKVMESRRRVLGEEHPNTLSSMSDLATTYHSQGRLKEAEQLGRRTMETSKRVLGEDHPYTLTRISNMAFYTEGPKALRR